MIVLELGSEGVVRDLAAGGAFVPHAQLRLGDDCDLVVRGANRRAVFPARVVYVDAHGGAGLELLGFSSETKAELDELEPIAPGTLAGLGEPAPYDSLTEPVALVDLQPIDDDLAIPIAAYDPQADAQSTDPFDT